jgi:hypothetical protein
MASQIKLRRDTAANWTANSTVVLAQGEPGFETNTGKLKIGDGTSTWAQLNYFGGFSITDFGEGFSLTDDDKIVTNKLYSTNSTQPTQHYRLELDTNGVIRLPDGSIINGSTIRGIAGTSELNYTGITIGPNSNDAEKTWMWVDHANAYISTNNFANTWTFGNNGSLSYPNTALQRDTATVTCAGNASTVVFTATGVSVHTIRLLIQVEGTVGAAVDMDTQACEMIIAKSFRADAIAASVYGVVHTSVAPLATFTAEWNVLTSKVEVLCTTPSANGVSVKIFATEITTSD